MTQMFPQGSVNRKQIKKYPFLKKKTFSGKDHIF